MNNDLKKIIATALATGTIVAGGMSLNGKPCDFKLTVDNQEICITKEQLQAVKKNLSTPNMDNLLTWDELENK